MFLSPSTCQIHPHFLKWKYTKINIEVLALKVLFFFFFSQEDDFEDMIFWARTLESQYSQLFDKVIINGDIAVAFRELKAALKQMEESKVQWVPTQWICSSPVTARRSCGHLAGWI